MLHERARSNQHTAEQAPLHTKRDILAFTHFDSLFTLAVQFQYKRKLTKIASQKNILLAQLNLTIG